MSSEDDGWSSLDDFIVLDSATESSSESDSSSSDSSSSSSFSAEPKVRKRNSTTPLSQKSTKPVTPVTVKDSAKEARKSVLESLVKKRRLSSGSASVRKNDRSVSSEEESSEFLVSDNNGTSSSSEGEEDPGFYARVSHIMEKRDRQEKSFIDSFSPRSAFLKVIIYYALCLVSENCVFPVKKPSLKKELPVFKAAARKIEGEIKSRRNSTKPSYWKPGSEFNQILDAFPNLRSYPFRRQRDGGECDGCRRTNRLSVVALLGGHAYNSQSLWEGNIKSWIRCMKLPLLGNAAGGSSDDSSEGPEEETPLLEPGSHFNLGGVCANNVRIYHILNHWKHSQLLKLYNWIVDRRLARNVKALVETLESEREGIVEQWFEQFQECTTLSETNCDKYTDPLGSHSPSGGSPSRRKSSIG